MMRAAWGGHPHFAQCGLDLAFAAFIDQAGDAIDQVDVDFGPARSLNASRFPDFSRPAHVPPGETWVADPYPRRPLAPLARIDADGRLAAAVDAFLRTMPYLGDDRLPYGMATLELRRDGVALKLPTRSGSLIMCSEARVQDDVVTGWAHCTMFHADLRGMSASDLLAAGGAAEHLEGLLLDDPLVATPRSRMMGMMGMTRRAGSAIDYPLDAFVAQGGTP